MVGWISASLRTGHALYKCKFIYWCVVEVDGTCAGAADNTVVDVWAAVNGDLQTVMSIMMLG